MTNPIAFNAFTMTGYQMKECADTLRTLFNLLDRESTDEDVRIYVEQVRDSMLKKWGEPK
jgi:hypothetical protein